MLRNRLGRIVGEAAGRRGFRFRPDRAVALEAVGVTVAAQIPGRVLGPRQRPVEFVPPNVRAHNEDLHRGDIVGRLGQLGPEEFQGFGGEAALSEGRWSRGHAEISFSDDREQRPVRPGADDQSGALAGVARRVIRLAAAGLNSIRQFNCGIRKLTYCSLNMESASIL